MEVLALGLCRTGTQSLAEALQVLGYKTIYHMKYVYKNQHDVDYWVPALEAKFEGKGKPIGRADFDKFLGEYSGVSDIPAAIFVSELIEAYPEAKIILTTRDEDKWLESMKSTIWYPGVIRKSRMNELMNKHIWGVEPVVEGQEAGDPSVNGIAKFRDHNDDVRRVAKERGLEILEYQVKEGWEPLCAFLGKSVPEVAFPRADDWAAFKNAHAVPTAPATS